MKKIIDAATFEHICRVATALAGDEKDLAKRVQIRSDYICGVIRRIRAGE